MSDRFARVVILAEDQRSANLLRRYVMRALNVGNRQIRQQISPASKGDAKQWVLRQYPTEVRELRRMHPKTGLVVHLDADTDTVADRASELAQALKAAGEDRRDPNGASLPRDSSAAGRDVALRVDRRAGR